MAESIAPRVKRPYQPNITGFLVSQRAGENEANTPSHTQRPQASLLPENHIQASLLSVGMRVRKAVPNGYQNTCQQGKLRLRPMTPLGEISGNSAIATKIPELVPYCGINKIGGYDIQQMREPDQQHTDQGPPIFHDELPPPRQLISTQVPSCKRQIEDIDEGQIETPSQVKMQQPSPPYLGSSNGQLCRKIRPLPRRIPSTRAVPQTTGPDIVMAGSDDFEDAPFLVPVAD